MNKHRCVKCGMHKLYNTLRGYCMQILMNDFWFCNITLTLVLLV